MLKIENTEVLGWGHAIRGMRNPMNSWEKSDSGFCDVIGDNFGNVIQPENYRVGQNDLDLMTRLRNAGADHRKFMRMIAVYVDLTAPLYWWKEFDTYKVGTVANSCSTMHKIAAKEFALEDFSCEHLFGSANGEDTDCWTYSTEGICEIEPIDILNLTIAMLNKARELYLDYQQKVSTGDQFAKNHVKEYWWQMIQLLPSSYNQRRTVMLNYEVLANIYKSRRNHKLDEWHTFCDWIEGLPYSELITSPIPQKGHEELQNYKEMFEQLKKVMEGKYSVTVCELCNIHGCGDSDEEHCKKCQFYKYSKWANGLEGSDIRGMTTAKSLDSTPLRLN